MVKIGKGLITNKHTTSQTKVSLNKLALNQNKCQMVKFIYIFIIAVYLEYK